MSNRDLRRAVRAKIERAILRIAIRHGTVTADDVRREVIIPADIDPRIVGTAFLALMLDAWIVEIGDLHTGRPVAHSRKIRVWRLCGDPEKIAVRLAGPSTGLPTKKTQPGLFDELEDPLPSTNAMGTAATVPIAANLLVDPPPTTKQTEEPTPVIVHGTGREGHP